jgi:hypothetical protein
MKKRWSNKERRRNDEGLRSYTLNNCKRNARFVKKRERGKRQNKSYWNRRNEQMRPTGKSLSLHRSKKSLKSREKEKQQCARKKGARNKKNSRLRQRRFFMSRLLRLNEESSRWKNEIRREESSRLKFNMKGKEQQPRSANRLKPRSNRLNYQLSLLFTSSARNLKREKRKLKKKGKSSNQQETSNGEKWPSVQWLSH